MGTFLITDPNGRKFKISGPNKEGALAALKAHLGDSQQQTVNPDGKTDRIRNATEIAQDSAKSLGSGLLEGAVGLLTVPADLGRYFGSKVASTVDTAMGYSPEEIQKRQSAANKTLSQDTLSAPTHEQAMAAVEAVTGPMHTPETTAGKYANTIGNFAAGAIGGPGGVVRKTAMAVVPAVASESAGQATEGTNFEPYARFAGALAGGAASAGKSSAPISKAAKMAPTTEALKNETTARYAQLRAAGIQYDNNAYTGFLQKLASDLHARGYRPRANNPSPIASDFQELVNAVNNPLDFSEMESLRRSIGNLPTNASKQDIATAQMVKEKFDEFLSTSPVVTNGNINPAEAAKLTRQARELAHRSIKERTIEEAIDRAANTASGFENGMRIEMRAILKNHKRRRGFSHSELSVMREIAGGTSTQNLMAQFGRLGISIDKLTSKASLLPALVAGGGWSAGAAAPAAGVVAAATGAKYASRKMAEKSAERLKAVIRMGRSDQAKAEAAAAAEKGNVLMRNALTLEALRNQGVFLPQQNALAALGNGQTTR